jgi:hypothetical protein
MMASEQHNFIMQVVAGLNIEELTRAVAAKIHLEPLSETVPDVEEIVGAVESKLNIGPFKEEVRSVSNRLDLVEKEFSTETGSVTQLQVAMDAIRAQQSTTSVERAGYVFKGPEDVEAFIMLAVGRAQGETVYQVLGYYFTPHAITGSFCDL